MRYLASSLLVLVVLLLQRLGLVNTENARYNNEDIATDSDAKDVQGRFCVTYGEKSHVTHAKL